MSLFSALWLRPWLLAAIGIGAAVALAVSGALITRLLSGWCVGVVAYIATMMNVAGRHSIEDLRVHASRLDDSAPVISLLAVAATVACFGAVAAIVLSPRQSAEGWLDMALAATTLVCAWAFVQIVFTIHYAHVYYGDDEPGQSRKGLDFAGDEDPDFWDFLYFAVTIGATAQTSDTSISSKRMRKIVTAQATYSYFFNTAVLAMAINMAAGLAQR